MEKIKKLMTGELMKYIVFGVLTTAVNFIVYFTVTGIFGRHTYLVANVTAWVIAVAFSYVTNKLYVFESKSWKREVVVKESISFVSSRLVSLGAEELGLFIMIELLSFGNWAIALMGFSIGGDTIAKLITQFVVIVLNYIFSKLIIFRKKN